MSDILQTIQTLFVCCNISKMSKFRLLALLFYVYLSTYNPGHAEAMETLTSICRTKEVKPSQVLHTGLSFNTKASHNAPRHPTVRWKHFVEITPLTVISESSICSTSFQNVTELQYQENHQFRLQSTEYILKLHSGSLVKAEDINDMDHLQSLLPMVLHVNSAGFIRWLESMDIDTRRDVLLLMDNLSFEGEAIEDVDKLLHFEHAEQTLVRMLSTMNLISTGDLINHLRNLSKEEKLDYSFTFNVFKKGTLQTTSNLEIPPPLIPVTCTFIGENAPPICDGLLFMLGFPTDISSIFSTGNFNIVVPLLFLTVEFSYFVASLLVSPFWSAGGKVIGGVGAFFATVGLVNDIASFVRGNLDSTESAIVALQMINNILTIAAYFGGMFATTGWGVVIALGALVIHLILNVIISILQHSAMKKIIKNQIEKLDFVLPLTEYEREKLEEAINSGSTANVEYLYRLAEIRVANDMIVNNQLQFLQENKAFSMMFSPSIMKTGSNYKSILNNVVDLREKKDRDLKREAPSLRPRQTCNPLKFGRYIVCAPVDSTGKCKTCEVLKGYYCKDAIGVEYKHNRDNDTQILVMLEEGKDTFHGALNSSYNFLVEKGEKDFFGGTNNDVFVLNSTGTFGTLDGMDGNDFLVMSEFISKSPSVDLSTNPGTVSFNGISNVVYVKNIEMVSGGVNIRDNIYAGCSTKAILGNGGGDQITVPNLPCSDHMNMVVQVNGTAKIINYAEEGMFIYRVLKSPRDELVTLDVVSSFYYRNNTHYVQLEYELDEISDVTVTENPSGGARSIDIISSVGKFTSNLAPLGPNQQHHRAPIVETHNNEALVLVTEFGAVNVVYSLNETRSAAFLAKHFGDWRFMVNADCPSLTGNGNNDTFVVNTSNFTGSINGGGGSHNHLILGGSYYPDNKLVFDIESNSVKKDGTIVLNFKDITQFSGRSGESDKIIIACSTKLANPMSGKPGDRNNQVIIGNSNCAYNTNIRLDSDTSVSNQATNSSFVYLIPFKENIVMDLDYNESLKNNHTIVFEFGAREITNGSLSENNRTLYVTGSNGITLSLPVFEQERENDNNETSFSFGPTMVTNETGFLSIKEEGGFDIIYNVSRPVEEIIGSPFARNMFFLYDNIENAQGGDNDDVFILAGEFFVGVLNGSKGIDGLYIDDDYNSDETVSVDMTNTGRYTYSRFFEIEDVFGRHKKSDVITAGCNSRLIDGKEGSDNSGADIVVFQDSPCTYNARVIVRNHTTIDNFAISGNFVYNIVEQFGFFDFLTPVKTLNHSAIVNLTQEFISNITFNKETLILNFDNILNQTLTLQFQNFTDDEAFYPQPFVVSEDFIQFRINSKQEPIGTHTITTTNFAGFPFIRNNFVITLSTTNVSGGDFVDTFFFQYANETTYIYGNSPSNIAIINGTEASKNVRITASDYIMMFENPTESNPTHQVIYKNVTFFMGRESASETYIADCNTEFVDLKGGLNSTDMDEIFFPNYVNCNYTSQQIMVFANNHTKIRNDAELGSFMYVVEENSDLYINCSKPMFGSHLFSVKLNLSDISSVHANFTGPCSISVFSANSTRNLTTYSFENAYPCVFPKIFTQDYFEVRVSPFTGMIYTSFNDFSNRTIAQLQDDLYPEAQRLNSSMMIMSNVTKEVIQIAGNRTEVLNSHPTSLTHMMGSTFENYFTVSKGANDTVSTIWFYSKPNAYNNINLSQLVRNVRQHRATSPRFRNVEDPLYIPEVTLSGNNLNIYVESSPHNHPADLTLVDYRDWYLNTTIVLHEVPMKLTQSNSTGIWTLVPIPVNVTNTIQVYDQKFFEDNQEIIINFPCPLEDQGSTVMYTGNNMVITNAFANNTSVDEEDFFVMTFDSFMTPSSRMDRGNPKNIKLSFQPNAKRIGSQFSGELLIDRVIPSLLHDVTEVILEKREELNQQVFGFSCKAEGKFRHPKKCNVYYECKLITPTEFAQYEFTCPTGTVYCEKTKQCGYASSCPCAL